MIKFPAVKPSEWPPQDLRLWELAKQPVELFEEGGIAADWSDAYVDNVQRTYGQFLCFLAGVGQLDTTAAPLERIEEPVIRSFIDAFTPGRADNTIARALDGIAAVVRACHPPDGAAWLTSLARRRSRRAKPVRSKQAHTASIEELTWLAERLIAEGRELLERGKRRGAPIFRDGLIIATLVVHPIRRSNLAGLQLGKTLFVDGNRIHVRFAAQETKNGVELTREYPAWLTAYFLEYLETVRPILREMAEGPDEGWVWIGRCGTRIIDQSFRVITTNRTRMYLGREVPPHNFRHSTVTDIARFDPDHIGITKDILGHKTSTTTEKFYILADSYRVSSEYQTMVERRRQRS